MGDIGVPSTNLTLIGIEASVLDEILDGLAGELARTVESDGYFDTIVSAADLLGL